MTRTAREARRSREPGPPRSVRGLTSARSARMPPSPRLSARMMKVMYFTTMTRMSDQTTSERMPSTLAGVGSTPWGPGRSTP